MGRFASFIRAALIGAGAMYLLDPRHGKRRRATIKEKSHRLAVKTADNTRRTVLDKWNRAIGSLIEMKQNLREEHLDDETLAARVRSVLGHVVSQPHQIEVKSDRGTVELSGIVPQRESQQLIRRIKHVRGVKRIKNNLEFEELANLSAEEKEQERAG